MVNISIFNEAAEVDIKYLPRFNFNLLKEIVYLPVIKTTIRGLLGKLSDNDIIEGIRRQDEAILNYLYDNYFRLVKNHIVKNNGSEEDAYDVFQDTIVVLYQKIYENNLKLTSDLRGYFFGIARNVWNNQLRQKEKTEELSNTDYPEDTEEDVTDSLFIRIMNRAFEKLKPECQEVLRLYYDGVSFEEIAKRMNFKNETYARRKKYLCKETLVEIIKSDPEYIDYLRFL